MANPSKQKGTQGETELLRWLNSEGYRFYRTAPGTKWDLEQDGDGPVVNVLATRPDHGRWLFSVPMLGCITPGAHIRIEVKRYKRFALHKIYEEKFA